MGSGTANHLTARAVCGTFGEFETRLVGERWLKAEPCSNCLLQRELSRHCLSVHPGSAW